MTLESILQELTLLSLSPSTLPADICKPVSHPKADQYCADSGIFVVLLFSYIFANKIFYRW